MDLGPASALAAAAALGAAAVVPSRGRPRARAVATGALLLAPPAALGVALARWGRPEPGTWLLLLPVTFTWLAFVDLRFGVSARLARRPARTRPDAAP